jgi:hypothetical protein
MPKNSGKLCVFKEIWRERPHVCEVTGELVYFSAYTFSHILTKGAHKDLTLWKLNIVLMTPECHSLWEFGDRAKLRSLPEWKWIFQLYDYLNTFSNKQRYLKRYEKQISEN